MTDQLKPAAPEGLLPCRCGATDEHITFWPMPWYLDSGLQIIIARCGKCELELPLATWSRQHPQGAWNNARRPPSAEQPGDRLSELEASIRMRGEALIDSKEFADIGEHYIGLADELRAIVREELDRRTDSAASGKE